MLMPHSPPETGNDTSSRFWQELEAKLAPLEDSYLHWHDLQQKTMPVQGINHKQWWQLLKAKRRARLQRLPFTIDRQSFYWVLDDHLLKAVTSIEQQLSLHLPEQFADYLPADNFIEEAVASCELADVNLDAAYDLLRTGRPAEAANENLCEALYASLSCLPTVALKPEQLAALNAKLTDLPAANWRQGNYSLQYNAETLFAAPAVEYIQSATTQLCEFANMPLASFNGYMPPLLKAIILHYLCAYIHPFVDGNGRTARALFYWQLLQAGYSLMQVVSLSEILLQQKEDYYRAFLYTQTDSNDLTYFMMQQLSALQTAITVATQRLQEKTNHIIQLSDVLTQRQRHVLVEMQQQPDSLFRLARYQQRMQITYETSRTDLMKLAKHGFAKKQKIGKAFVYRLVQ
jgi:fido (protein-threonine AMPylation protein)